MFYNDGLIFTKKGQQKMKENFITSIVSTWSNSISEYFKLLQEYPIKLVSLILLKVIKMLSRCPMVNVPRW